MSKNVPQTSQASKSVQKYSKTAQKVPKHPKWVKMYQNIWMMDDWLWMSGDGWLVMEDGRWVIDQTGWPQDSLVFLLFLSYRANLLWTPIGRVTKTIVAWQHYCAISFVTLVDFAKIFNKITQSCCKIPCSVEKL